MVELESGMNYWSGAQWVPSEPGFYQDQDGAFLADKVLARTILSPDINVAPALTITMPDGLEIGCSPVAMTLYDATSGSLAVLAGITNSLGVLIDTNRVLYDQAFSGAGVCAAIVYTVEKGSIAQDVVFTGRFDAAALGFSTNHRLRVQVWTEISRPPSEPDIIRQPIYVERDQAVRNRMVTPDLMDELIGFGQLVFGPGFAYTMPTEDLPNGTQAAVGKELATVDQ
jgi:hypothetical protein